MLMILISIEYIIKVIYLILNGCLDFDRFIIDVLDLLSIFTLTSIDRLKFYKDLIYTSITFSLSSLCIVCSFVSFFLF